MPYACLSPAPFLIYRSKMYDISKMQKWTFQKTSVLYHVRAWNYLTFNILWTLFLYKCDQQPMYVTATFAWSRGREWFIINLMQYTKISWRSASQTFFTSHYKGTVCTDNEFVFNRILPQWLYSKMPNTSEQPLLFYGKTMCLKKSKFFISV